MRKKYMTVMAAIGLFLSNSVWAQEADLPPPDQSFWQTLVMIGIAFLFFYVILWRPEQKRRKAQEEQRGALKKGDRVIAMGILGTIVRVGEETVIVRMYDGAKLEFYKAAISEVLPETGEPSKKVENIEDETV